MAQNYAQRPSPFKSLQNKLRANRSESCSVYGSGEAYRVFLHTLGKDGIEGDISRPLPTKYLVIMMEDDQQAFEFYHTYQTSLYGGSVVLILNQQTDLSMVRGKPRTILIPAMMATMFWREYPAKPDEKIAIIGEDPLVSGLLRQGLWVNLYSPAQCIQYHIWGEGNTTGLSMGLSQITMDKIMFHRQHWSQDLSAISGKDRIILCCSQAESGRVLQALAKLPDCPIIYTVQPRIDQVAGLKVVGFGDYRQLLTPKNLLEEEWLTEAKLLNAHHVTTNHSQPWEELTAFQRASYACRAGYLPVIRRLFRAGIPPETLAELEHIRWCRFYYLHGWQHGAATNEQSRTHRCLLPYNQLPEEAKQSARNTVTLALN